jgi:rare lipoprotein A
MGFAEAAIGLQTINWPSQKGAYMYVKRIFLMVGLTALGLVADAATPIFAPQKASQDGARDGMPALDRTGRQRYGKASFYADRFGGRKMANGQRMDLHGDNAASRTLPLGTTAKVTNLETGKSTVVTVQDRGPYVDGRIVDLSPGTARKIGLTRREGIVKVAVSPIAVRMPDGRIKLGAAASDPEVIVNLMAKNERPSDRMAARP